MSRRWGHYRTRGDGGQNSPTLSEFFNRALGENARRWPDEPVLGWRPDAESRSLGLGGALDRPPLPLGEPGYLEYEVTDEEGNPIDLAPLERGVGRDPRAMPSVESR